MASMGHGGMSSMGRRAERTPHGRSARAAAADLPKKMPSLKKLWPQITALVRPRIGLLVAGMGLMVVNRVALLVMPYVSKPLMDKVLNQNHPHPELLPYIIALNGAGADLGGCRGERFRAASDGLKNLAEGGNHGGNRVGDFADLVLGGGGGGDSKVLGRQLVHDTLEGGRGRGARVRVR